MLPSHKVAFFGNTVKVSAQQFSAVQWQAEVIKSLPQCVSDHSWAAPQSATFTKGVSPLQKKLHHSQLHCDVEPSQVNGTTHLNHH